MDAWQDWDPTSNGSHPLVLPLVIAGKEIAANQICVVTYCRDNGDIPKGGYIDPKDLIPDPPIKKPDPLDLLNQ